MNIVYFVHGTSVDNELKLSSGWSDSALSQLGISQTLKAAELIDETKFDLVISSDLLRARQSAAILFPNTKTIFDCRLRECNYGIFNGTEHKNVIYRNHIDLPFPCGESLKDVENRVQSLVSEVREQYYDKSVALIGHRAPQLALEVISKRITWFDAIENDWRMVGQWQLGWNYNI